MRERLCLVLGLVLLVPFGATSQVQTASRTADEVLERVNGAWQGDSFHAIMSLDVVLGGQTKSHRLEVWTLGEQLALVRVLYPEIDRNSGYLQLGDDLWYYAPGIGSIELPAVAIGDALFGAGPSLEDVSHGTLSEDYDVTLDRSPFEGDAGYVLTLTPHPDAPVVYGQIQLTVTTEYVIERMVYFDQRGNVLKEAVFSDVLRIGSRRLPTSVVIEDGFGDRTIQTIEFAEFDFEIDKSFFSLETFQSWGNLE